MADTFQPIGAVAVNVVARCAAQADVPVFPRVPRAAYSLARHLAKNEVKGELRGKGIRMSLVPPAVITERAMAYLAEHPELLTVEREERERERQLRKLRKSGLSDLMVTPDCS